MLFLVALAQRRTVSWLRSCSLGSLKWISESVGGAVREL